MYVHCTFIISFRLSRIGVRAEGWSVGGKIVKESDGAAILQEKGDMAPPYKTACDVMLQEMIDIFLLDHFELITTSPNFALSHNSIGFLKPYNSE